MTVLFDSKEWDKAMAQHARKQYLGKQIKKTAVTVSALVLAVSVWTTYNGTASENIAQEESLESLVTQQVVAVYESAVESEDDLLMWDF